MCLYVDLNMLLMEEILDQLIGNYMVFPHYLQGFIHPRWCRISSINSITTYAAEFNQISASIEGSGQEGRIKKPYEAIIYFGA